MTSQKPKIGIIGAGRLGTSLARILSNVGYEVAIINVHGLSSLRLQLQILLPKVAAMETPALITWADVVILAVPLRNYTALPLRNLRGKIVIDAMNYWAPIDGKIPEFEAYSGSSSERVAAAIPNPQLVKTFNSVAYTELEEPDIAIANSELRAIPLVGDDRAAKKIAADLITAVGFEPVDLGPLARGAYFQPDTRLFNQRLTKAEILELTGK